MRRKRTDAVVRLTKLRAPPKKERLPPRPDLRVVTILGVSYFIPWDKIYPGNSVFIPTVATKFQVERILAPIAVQLGIPLTVRVRCEYGRFGVRVWRV